MCIKENRKIERYSLHVPVVINTPNEEYKGPDTTITRDISSEGVFIESDTLDLSPGSKVHLEMVLTVKVLFKVPDKVILGVDGRITRATNHGIAVKFINGYSITPLLPGVQLG
ncbi:MAG: PilZ domain-containing protein [Spirochaetes bacterium]|nr:PilZ domain-containing protein [Spirochaetota bacterium]